MYEGKGAIAGLTYWKESIPKELATRMAERFREWIQKIIEDMTTMV